MANIRRISQIAPTLAFTEFDMIEKYRKSFERSELGHVHASFPFESFAKKMGLKESPLGRTGHFSPSGKIALMVLKSYTGFSDQCLIEHLNGNIHYQLFCGIMIDPSAPITNFKIVSAIRSELSQKMVIEDLQEVLAQAWRPLLCDKRIACPYLRWRSKSIHYLPNLKLGRGSFRHFYFSYFTFHFYMYKVLRGIRKKVQ